MDRLISEQDVIDAMAEALKHGEGVHNLLSRILAIPSAEPCEDAISREDVVNTMHIIMDGAYIGDNDEDSNCYESLDDIKEQYIEIAKGMKSVTPQEKTGHWIKVYEAIGLYRWKCDKCKKHHRAMYDYCPSCGARMGEPQEISDYNLKMWHDIYEEEKRRKGDE